MAYAPVDDLRPLQGMPLEELFLNSTQVTDLSPLRGMVLKDVSLQQMSVSDLAPLKGMPIEVLYLYATRVHDLSPLAGAPLRKLTYEFRHAYDPDEKLLRTFALETINGKPAGDFWHEIDERRRAVDDFVAETAKLAPAEQVQAVTRRLREANPDFRTAIGHTDGAGKVAEASLAIDQTTDLVPLRAFTSLRRLSLLGARDVLDLSPLTSLPLEELTAPDNLIYTHARILEGMSTLSHINGHPIADFQADLRNLRATEWTLGKGSRLGALVVRQQNNEVLVKDRSELPPPPFRVVQILIYNDTSITTGDLELLRGLQDLRIFETAQSQIDDAGLEILRTLPNIASLNVRGSRITDDGMRSVGQMPSLTKLIINETSVSDAGIEHILACKNLEDVQVGRTKLTGAGVRKLLQLPNLKVIDCYDVPLSREDFAAFISQGARLELVSLSVSGDDDVAELVKLPKLRGLSLTRSTVTDRCFELVASNPRLTFVTFNECRGVTDQGVAHLRGMPQLNLIELGVTGITDVALTHLVDLKQLNYLVLVGTKVGGGSVPSLKQMTALKHLELTNTEMTAADIAELRAALQNCQIVWDGK